MTAQERLWILGGGLASGKSSVRRVLTDCGVATIDADSVGHAVLEQDGEAFAAVAERWPDAMSAGHIDRRALADIVFNDPELLGELEGMTHPPIFDRIRARVEEISGPVVVEMPIISPALGSRFRRLVVDSRDDDKLQRAIARGMDEADAEARLGAQPSREEWLAVADLVVPNHGSLLELERCAKGVAKLL